MDAPLTIRMHAADNVAIVANHGGLPAGTALEQGLTLKDQVRGLVRTHLSLLSFLFFLNEILLVDCLDLFVQMAYDKRLYYPFYYSTLRHLLHQIHLDIYSFLFYPFPLI